MPRSGTWHVQHLQTSAGRLFIRRRDGAGIPLLLWPSIFYDHSLYLGLCEWLDNPVILLDSPGHGRSEGCPSPLTLELCAKAQDEILAALGIRDEQTQQGPGDGEHDGQQDQQVDGAQSQHREDRRGGLIPHFGFSERI